MKYGLACLFGLLFSASSFAVDSTGNVFDIYVFQNTSTVLYRIEGTQLNACATTNRYAIDLAQVGGEAFFSLILAAEATGKEVSVRGTDRCDIHHDSEDANWIKTNS